jgi:hypothetical protein
MKRLISRAWSHVEQWPHLVQGVMFGASTLLAAVLVYYALLALWPWPWGYPQRDSVSDPAGVFAAQLAFGQVYTAFLGIFLAGTLGFFAIREFAEAHQGPRLRLTFDNDSEALDAAPASDNPSIYRFTVVLHNESPEVAVWYMVQIATPFLHWSPLHHPHGNPISTIVGTQDNWREFGERARRPDQSVTEAVTFRSLGREAAFWRFPLRLCEFTVLAGPVSGREYTCEYVIGLDRGSPIRRSLTVRFAASETDTRR